MQNIFFRMISDGTLLNAMAVATGTFGEIIPRTFVSVKIASLGEDYEDYEDEDDEKFLAGPDEDWVEPLSNINNSILREHISTFCLDYGDARCAYWRFAGSCRNYNKLCGTPESWLNYWFKELGWEQIAKWEITDGPPAELVIVRIPPGKETPMTPR